MSSKEKYVAFLRGINVGGHHKVPMADLKTLLEKKGLKNIVTLLNSGNIIFDTNPDKNENIEEVISTSLEKHFGFPVPTVVRRAEAINELFNANPFDDVLVTKDIRLYISLMKKNVDSNLELPWISSDQSYEIRYKKDQNILSVLDLSISKTPKAMEILEKTYGKNITTRNWNTIERIVKKL